MCIRDRIGKDHQPSEAQPVRALQRVRHQRRGDGGISRFRPTEAHAFPQHPGDFADVGIGVGIGTAAPDPHQQRVAPVVVRPELGFAGLDPLAGCLLYTSRCV